MADYIEREEALHAVNEFFHDPKVDVALYDVPAANVREDVQGEWKWFDEEHGTPIDGWDREWGWRCSCCKDTLNDEYDDPDSPPKFNFCPNCGARMVGGGER